MRVAQLVNGRRPEVGQSALRALLPLTVLAIPVLALAWPLIYLTAIFNPLGPRHPRPRRRHGGGAEPMTAAIEIRGLRKAYGDTVAVRDIDLEVEQGEILALLGPNGAGKTTTVEILEGFRDPRRRHGLGAGHGSGQRRPGACASGWGSSCSPAGSTSS